MGQHQVAPPPTTPSVHLNQPVLHTAKVQPHQTTSPTPVTPPPPHTHTNHTMPVTAATRKVAVKKPVAKKVKPVVKKVAVKKKRTPTPSSTTVSSKTGKAKVTPTTTAASAVKKKKGKAVRNLKMMLEMEKLMDEGNSYLQGTQNQNDAITQKLAAAVKSAEEIDVAKLDPLDMAAKRSLDDCLPAWKANLAQRAFTPSVKVWHVNVVELQAVVERCVSMYGKTPLVIDNAQSAASTYFKYTAGVTLDAKAAVVQKAMKMKTLEEVQDEMRKKVVVAMQMGYPLIIELQNSAPNFKGQLCSDTTIPLETLCMAKYHGFCGKNDKEYFSSAANTEAFHDKIAQPGTDELRDLKHARAVGRHTKMYPVLVTQFDVEDYEEFLSGMLPPMENFQAIHVLDN